ncbi:uncharacterized protein LOC129737781 [Uranotaenia lowii]|uniref:uncharacterized protein LOC129737781 n=1 Tax=Uranotaenia lowii TaxID=190385 RepID=UPI002479834B|nr:uncharacterized protein LOC129737781 [Uranotaenia lowii]
MSLVQEVKRIFTKISVKQMCLECSCFANPTRRKKFARTRNICSATKFCANSSQTCPEYNLVCPAMKRLRDMAPKNIAQASVMRVAMAMCAFMTVTTSALPTPLSTDQPKLKDASIWTNPCSVPSYFGNQTELMTPEKRILHLRSINDSIAATKVETDRFYSSNTDWASTQNKQKYKFMPPYKKNQTTWEYSVQVYVASIEVIYQKQSQLERASNSDKPDESLKLKELRKSARGLLCNIQEYRNNTKNGRKRQTDQAAISADSMNSIIKFDMTDPQNMELHKWFLKCHFRCFLENMEQHVDFLMDKYSATSAQRSLRTTKRPRKNIKKGRKGNGKKNGRPLKNKCCIVNNKPTSPAATPREPTNVSKPHKVNNNKKKLNASQPSKLIKPSQKKVQRKGNKKSQ